MGEVIHGTVHGRTIQLDEDPGIGDGSAVEVVLRCVSPSRESDVGPHSAAGMLADLPGVEDDLEAIQRQRKAAEFRETDS